MATAICSTGAFSRAPDLTDLEGIVARARGLDVSGFELIRYGQWGNDDAAVAHLLSASGLAFPALHASKDVAAGFGGTDTKAIAHGLNVLTRDCSLAAAIGAGVVVLHIWDLPHSDREFDRNLAQLGPCLDIAEDAGVQLAIETIPCATSTPLQNLERVLERDARASVSLDTEFLALHEEYETALACDWLWSPDVVVHIHIKDFDGDMVRDGWRRYLHPGQGRLDFGLLEQRLVAERFAGLLSLEASAVRPDLTVDTARLDASLRWITDVADRC